MREKLEDKAKLLGVEFTKDTSDETLDLMIQLAEKNQQLKESENVNSELAEKLVKLETAAEDGTGLTVIKHGKKLYTTHAKKFLYNPVTLAKVKRGAGGIMGRGRENDKGGSRIIEMKDIELKENEAALNWLVTSGSNLIKEVQPKKGE
jgi:hypothetical protein